MQPPVATPVCQYAGPGRLKKPFVNVKSKSARPELLERRGRRVRRVILLNCLHIQLNLSAVSTEGWMLSDRLQGRILRWFRWA